MRLQWSHSRDVGDDGDEYFADGAPDLSLHAFIHYGGTRPDAAWKVSDLRTDPAEILAEGNEPTVGEAKAMAESFIFALISDPRIVVTWDSPGEGHPSAVRDNQGRVRVEGPNGRFGWAYVTHITWDASPPIQLQLGATIVLTVEGDAVTKVAILPATGAGDPPGPFCVFDGNGATDEQVGAAIEIADSTTWAPLEGLPDNVRWES